MTSGFLSYPKWDILLQGKNLLLGSNFIPQRVDPALRREAEAKDGNDRVTSLEI